MARILLLVWNFLSELIIVAHSFDFTKPSAGALPTDYNTNANAFSNTFLQKPRILGGNEAKPGQYPSVISLHATRTNPETNETSMQHDCGGAIANENHVLTAAHCVWDKHAKDLLVLAGVHNMKKEEESQQKVKVSRIILHPNYTAQDAAGPFDIAILKLKKPLEFNARVGKAEKANKNEPSKGQCFNAGWGNQFPVSSMHYRGSDTLTTGKTYIVSKDECRAAYPTFKNELETALCARAGMGHGTCQGDSGGPLICHRENKPYLAGLVSFGFKVCNNGYHPDVYTDMSHPAIYNFVDSFLRTGEIDMAALEEKKQSEFSSSSSAGRSSASAMNANPAISQISSSLMG